MNATVDPREMLSARRDTGAGLPTRAELAGRVSEARERYRAEHQRMLEFVLQEFFVAWPKLRAIEWTIAAGSLGTTMVKGGPKEALNDLRELLKDADHRIISHPHYRVTVLCGRDGRMTVRPD